MLKSAEHDATRVFRALTSGPGAIYTESRSKLIKSPSRGEIEAAFLTYLQHHKEPDVFTLFFAGHGGTIDGSLYLCPKEADIGAISVTALNITNVLRFIGELRPSHAYIIIDACQSGGISYDLGTILRGDILSRSPGFSLSILTAAQASQEARELPSGGFLTNELLKALNGSNVVNDSESFLGLGEIAKRIRLPISKAEQQPNFWSLNITGADIFCRNPHYSASLTHTPFGVLRHGARQNPISPAIAQKLWRFYLDLPGADLEQLPTLFGKAVDELVTNPVGLAASTYALTKSLAEALEDDSNTFSRALTHAAMAQALMPHRRIPEAEKSLEVQLESVIASALSALQDLKTSLESERHYLLGPSGLPDLYHLPRRVTRILGWIGFLLLASDQREAVSSRDVKALRELVNLILSQYGNSVVAVCDDQAGPLLLFLAQCKRLGWMAEAEEIVGRLYNDFNENFGRVLIDDASASDVVEYLVLRFNMDEAEEGKNLQNPTELFAVILIAAAMFDLDEALDPSLIQLDRANFFFYVPTSYDEFFQPVMEGGQSIIFQLGHALKPGYGVWSIGDMHRVWRHHIEPLVEDASLDCSPDSRLAAAMCSLVLCDRVAWFAVPELVPRTAMPHSV